MQGSVLGPLLFLLFINDLPDFLSNHDLLVTSNIKLFADDIKTYSVINGYEDAAHLELVIDCIMKWCTTWQLLVNYSKCSVMHRGKSRINPEFSYVIANSDVARADSISDLGIIIDKNLGFSLHIANIAGKA